MVLLAAGNEREGCGDEERSAPEAGGRSRSSNLVRRNASVGGGGERDVGPLRGCKEKKKEWAKRWQCNTEVQDLKDKPWRIEELRCSEKRLPRLREDNLEKAAANIYKAAMGVGCDGFHSKVPLWKEVRNQKTSKSCWKWQRGIASHP